MAEQGKPIPRVTNLTKPFWDAAAQEKLVMQRCGQCQAYVWCPRSHCMECGSNKLEWTSVSGRGTVFSFTVIRQVVGRGAAAFEKEIPYIVAWVDLEEGPRFCTNVVDCPIEEITIGMPVEVVFDKVNSDISMPKFRPRS